MYLKNSKKRQNALVESVNIAVSETLKRKTVLEKCRNLQSFLLIGILFMFTFCLLTLDWLNILFSIIGVFIVAFALCGTQRDLNALEWREPL
jgi:hypothetical protein